MTDAIVLAGGASEPGLSSDLPNKGFLQISGRSLVGYVVQAVREARGVGPSWDHPVRSGPCCPAT